MNSSVDIDERTWNSEVTSPRRRRQLEQLQGRHVPVDGCSRLSADVGWSLRLERSSGGRSVAGVSKVVSAFVR